MTCEKCGEDQCKCGTRPEDNVPMFLEGVNQLMFEDEFERLVDNSFLDSHK